MQIRPEGSVPQRNVSLLSLKNLDPDIRQ